MYITKISAPSHSNTVSVKVSTAGETQFQCAARLQGSDYFSDPVKIEVREKPTPTVKVQPDPSVFIGETVTLTCEIHSGGSWSYEWYKDRTLQSQQWNSVQTFKADGNHRGAYSCRGGLSGRITTHTSAAVTLTVSEKPKPTITSNPEGAALTGNTVTLTCTLAQSDGWTFSWVKGSQTLEITSSSSIHTISSVSVSDRGQYWCRAQRGSYYTDSDALWVNVTVSPKPVLTIAPDKGLFKGENVTLRCDIEAGGDTEWNYIWFKDNNELKQFSRSQEITVRSVTESNSGKYTCRGERKSDSQKSEISDAVTLTVSGEAQAVLSVSPQSWLTEGDSVTLSCEVDISSKGWTFSWYRAVPYRQGLTQITDVHGKVVYSVELLSDSRRGAGGSYTLSPAALYHTGVYVCGAERGEPAFHTQYSSPQPLWITGNSPPVSLIISPSRTQHFSTDSLSLSCEGHRDSAGWRVRRYTHSEKVSNCSSVPGFTCNISSLSTSDTGVYWCQSESGERSDPVNITVHNGDVILESPVHSVSEGYSLTFLCLYRSTKSSLLPADFYKDGVLLQKQTTGEMTIHKVSKSHEGLYHCKHPEKGESPQSWISVRAIISNIPTPHRQGHHFFTVSPKSVVSIAPDKRVIKGESVTLKCDIEAGGDTEWNYIWFKDNNELKQFSRSQEITVRSVTESNSGKYTCRGERKSDSQKSEISDAVTLTVSGNSPPVSLIISPSRTQHFSTESLSLSCEGHRDSAGWRVRRYTHSEKVSNCSSVPGFTCNISSLSTSDTGVYWCQSESGESSDPVNITVHNGDVILESPVHSVSERYSLTRRCLYHSTKASLLSADFYKDGGLLQNQTTGEMTIHKVSKSHEGLYYCKHPEEGESPRSWISVRSEKQSPLSGSGSAVITIGVAVGGTVILLLIIILGWFCCYKKKKRFENTWSVYSEDVTGPLCLVGNQQKTKQSENLWISPQQADGDVILESPVHSVSEGDSLTLRCLNRSTNSSHLPADFYKDGVLLQNQTTGEMTLHKVSKADEGLYHCKHPEKGESPRSWISVRGVSVSESPFSVLRVLSSLMAVTPYLITSIVLGVKCYRARDALNNTEAVDSHLPPGDEALSVTVADVMRTFLKFNKKLNQ
ncbi:Fc receptor-like protein 5 [Hoplias malabaricus]|uniref:Fc receptor-like protein 5 n=1 Tax=Hoplias malabaricus TaxID=27720 RepID=UPI00346226A3